MSERYWQKEIETCPREKLEALQLERLKKTVRHTFDNVEIYRERMKASGVSPDDIKSLDDLRKLPFTCKQDLRDTYPYGMFAVPMKDVVRLHASSGTTGKQIVVGYTRRDLEVWNNMVARQLVAAGADENDFVHVAYGYGLFTGGLGLHGGAELLGAAVLPVSSGNTARQITIMQDLRSSVLACTPSYAMYLAESVHAAGIDPKTLNLKAGIFGAEPWTEEMRHKIEEMLNVKAYDIYGLTETMGPGVAYECSCQNGMHVNEDSFIIEVIDPETELPVPDGTPGELVFTSVNKEAFPVIRYRTRDIGTITHERCECGRTFVRMSKPRGRTDDMLIIRGVNVFPSQIETVLINNGYSPNYLIIVDRVNNLDTMEIHVEMNESSLDDTLAGLVTLERKLTDDIKSLLGVSAKVKLVNPHSIERSTGKAKRVIDNRKLLD